LFGKGGDAESFSELADGANVVVLATSLGFGFGEEHDVNSESEKRKKSSTAIMTKVTFPLCQQITQKLNL
jgi:hypothetical protein